MEHVVFHVDDWNLGPFRKVTHNLVTSSVGPVCGFAEDSNRNPVSVSVENSGGVRDAFLSFSSHLCFTDIAHLYCWAIDGIRLQIMGMPSKLRHSSFETVACSKRGVVEQHKQRLVFKQLVRLTRCESTFQVGG